VGNCLWEELDYNTSRHKTADSSYAAMKECLVTVPDERCQQFKRLEDKKKKKKFVLACVFTISGPVCKHTMITKSHLFY